jgi:hypothetical protein
MILSACCRWFNFQLIQHHKTQSYRTQFHFEPRGRVVIMMMMTRATKSSFALGVVRCSHRKQSNSIILECPSFQRSMFNTHRRRKSQLVAFICQFMFAWSAKKRFNLGSRGIHEKKLSSVKMYALAQVKWCEARKPSSEIEFDLSQGFWKLILQRQRDIEKRWDHWGILGASKVFLDTKLSSWLHVRGFIDS